MTESGFLAYIGDPDIHDGYIRGLYQDNDLVRVIIEGATGRRFVVEFYGVAWVEEHHAQDMMLYALAEFRSDKPGRCFVFVNWDEEDDARLAVGADEVSITYEQQDEASK